MEARWLVWRQHRGRYTPRPSRPAPERNMTGRRLLSGADHQPTRGLPRRNPTKRIASRGIDIEWNRLRATLLREACHDADSDLPGHGQSATGRGTVRGGGSAALCRRDVQAECDSPQRRCTRNLQASAYYTRTLVNLNPLIACNVARCRAGFTGAASCRPEVSLHRVGWWTSREQDDWKVNTAGLRADFAGGAGNPPRLCREGRRKLTESAKEFPKVSARQSPKGSLREARKRLSPAVSTNSYLQFSLQMFLHAGNFAG